MAGKINLFIKNLNGPYPSFWSRSMLVQKNMKEIKFHKSVFALHMTVGSSHVIFGKYNNTPLSVTQLPLSSTLPPMVHRAALHVRIFTRWLLSWVVS